MRKKIFLIIALLLLILLLALTLERPTMHHFRFMQDGVAFGRAKKPICLNVNWEGSEQMKLAGSGALKLSYFKKAVIDNYPSLYIINVEFNPEELLYYKNNHVKSYFGLVLQKDGSFKENPRPWYKRLRYYVRRFLNGLPLFADKINNKNFKPISEEVYFSSFPNLHYFSPLPARWLYDPFYIDEMIQIFRSIPEDGLVYFHCRHGRGRTTTFMILYDIFKNYDKLSLDEIIVRHYCLGGENIYEDQAIPGGSWTQDALTARRKLIEVFYDYMKEAYPEENWMDWLKSTGNDRYFKVEKYKNGM